MNKIIFIFILYFSLTIPSYANDDLKENKFIENMSYMLNHVNQKDYLNDDKKFILYQKILFIYKSIISSESEYAFTNYLVHDFFNLSLCIPYLLQSDSEMLVTEIYYIFENIENEENILRYSKIHDIIFSEDIKKIAGDYIENNLDKVNEICFSSESFSNTDDIIKILK